DVIVIGAVRPELGGSEWAAVVHGLDGGMPPAADLDVARVTHDLVAELVRERVVAGVHDVSDGGLAVALAEMAINGGVGARVDLTVEGCTPPQRCLAELARVVVAAPPPPLTPAGSGRGPAAAV